MCNFVLEIVLHAFLGLNSHDPDKRSIVYFTLMLSITIQYMHIIYSVLEPYNYEIP
jgi:hypothetical protein